jgi:hypothetical protein
MSGPKCSLLLVLLLLATEMVVSALFVIEHPCNYLPSIPAAASARLLLARLFVRLSPAGPGQTAAAQRPSHRAQRIDRRPAEVAKAMRRAEAANRGRRDALRASPTGLFTQAARVAGVFAHFIANTVEDASLQTQLVEEGAHFKDMIVVPNQVSRTCCVSNACGNCCLTTHLLNKCNPCAWLLLPAFGLLLGPMHPVHGWN